MFKIFTTVLLLLIAAVVFFGYTQPTYSHVQELKSQSAQLDQIMNEASEFQKLKSQLMSRYNALPAQKLTRLNKLLPDHVDNVRLILDLGSLAGQDGLALQNIVINTDSGSQSSQSASASGALGALGKDSSPVGSLTLQFKTQGTYENFTKFLSDLESSLRLVDVVHLTVKPLATSNGTQGADQYSYDMQVRTYWLK